MHDKQVVMVDSKVLIDSAEETEAKAKADIIDNLIVLLLLFLLLCSRSTSITYWNLIGLVC